MCSTGDFSEARKAMQKGEIYGIFHIPDGFRREVSTGKQPVISFYTNDTYILPGSLVYKDMRLQSALANGAVQRTLLLAKGEDGPQLQAKLMPVTVDTNPLNNPWISYAIYLASILMPAFVCMFAMFTTAYSISEEIKDGSSRDWIRIGNGSVVLSLMGKILPADFCFHCDGNAVFVRFVRLFAFSFKQRFFPYVSGYGAVGAGFSGFCHIYHRIGTA